MKTCPKCKILKESSDFNKDSVNEDGLQWCCIECTKKSQKEWYQRNKEQVKEKTKQRFKHIQSWWKEYKQKLKCIKCGESHPATLDFHHRDPSEKERSVAVLVQNANSIEKILKEIEKCDVLCSNCHRKHHYDLANNSR